MNKKPKIKFLTTQMNSQPPQPQEIQAMEPHQPEEMLTSSEPPLTGSPDNPPSHFDDLLNTPEAAPAAAALPPGTMGKDEFHTMFVGGFKAGHLLTGLQSLHIGPEREGSAQACSHAIYDSIVDCPSLHFMLEPRNKWWSRAIAIGAFTIPTAIGIKTELQARRAAALSAQEKPMDFTAAKNATQAAPTFTPEQEALMRAANAV